MQKPYPAFHAEYWVYIIAAFVIIVVATLLYTMDGPIKFSSWFCRSFTLASTSDDARTGLCSPVRRAVPPTRPDSGPDGIVASIGQAEGQIARSLHNRRIDGIGQKAMPRHDAT
jgi:hypothetical protein